MVSLGNCIKNSSKLQFFFVFCFTALLLKMNFWTFKDEFSKAYEQEVKALWKLILMIKIVENGIRFCLYIHIEYSHIRWLY